MIHYVTTNGTGNAWVANELREVRRAGIPFRLHAMRLPQETFHGSEWARDIHRETRQIYPLPVGGTLLSLLAAPFLFRGRFLGALGNALFGERESLRGRIAGIFHLLVACHWARRNRREEVDHIHAQWIHSSGTIAMYSAWLLGIPFSFTGHAADLFRDRVALRDKIRRAEFIVCISTFHRGFYLEHGARPERLVLAYCGIDVGLFSPRAKDPDGERDALRVLSSGRLVEKKGFPVLLESCRILRDRGVPVRCVIGGSGPLDGDLRRRVTELKLADSVEITGKALKQEEIPEFMHGGDVYCLPCVWAGDDDVDGLPQMLMEAMACGLPAVSTRLVGIPDLVRHEETGLLAMPGDPEGLADALERLSRDRELAGRLAEAGRRHVLETFDIASSLEPLLERFRTRLSSSGTAPTPRTETKGVCP